MIKITKFLENQGENISLSNFDLEHIRKAAFDSGLIGFEEATISPELIKAHFDLSLVLAVSEECGSDEKVNILNYFQSFYNLSFEIQDKALAKLGAKEILNLIVFHGVVKESLNLKVVLEVASNVLTISNLLMQDVITDRETRNLIFFKFSALFSFYEMLLE